MFQAFVSYPERASAPNGVVDQQYGDLGKEGLQDTPLHPLLGAGGGGLGWGLSSHLKEVRRRAHSRRVTDKATPPHGRWGGVGVWRSLAQGEVRMVPFSPTATKVLLP